MSLEFPEQAFELTSGELATFTVQCDSGRTKTCAFCPRCGTRIYHLGTDGSMSLKPGTLDDRSWLAPDRHYWTKRKQAWVVVPEGVACVEDDG